jgi:hypothetical protein
MMKQFSLVGKIITKDNKPAENYSVLAYDQDFLNPSDFLGQTVTDSKGFFRIEFDRSKFAGFFERLEGSPDVYLIIREGNEQKDFLKTIVAKTNWEIVYRIKLDQHIPNPEAPDIYAGNAQRLLSMLNEIREFIGIEQQINIDILKNKDLRLDVKKNLEEYITGNEDRRRNFEHLLVIFNSLVDSYFEEIKLGTIGYDGPQVPRQPRRENYDQVIIWPRQETFRWE